MRKMFFNLMVVMMAFVILTSACVQPAQPPAEPTSAPTTAPVVQVTEAVPPTDVPTVEPTAVPEPTEVPVEDIELWASGRVTEAGSATR